MSRLSKAAIVGVLTGIFGMVACLTSVGLDLEEHVGLGSLFKLRGVREAPSDVLIVAMDEVCSHDRGLSADPAEWPRALHASSTDKLAKEGAAVIAFDFFFGKERSAEGDSSFAEAVSNAGNVVLCQHLKKRTPSPPNSQSPSRLPPIPQLASSAAALAPFPLPKVPGKVSQYWTFYKTAYGDTPTLPVVAFKIFALQVYDEFVQLLEKVSPPEAERLRREYGDHKAVITNKRVEELIRTLRRIFKNHPLIPARMLEELKNSTTISTDPGKTQILKSLVKMYQSPDSHYLNLYGPPGTVTTIPYCDLIGRHEKPAAIQEELDLNGKAVFIGLSERLRPGQQDDFPTSFSRLSGVELAATAFANILEDMPVRPLSLGSHLGTILVWGMLLGFLCAYLRTVIAAPGLVGMGVLYLFFARYQFANAGHWYPLIIPLFLQTLLAFFGTTLWMYFEAHKERENIRRAIGYYLPDKVVDQLARNAADIRAGGQVVYGTCLCTDAEQYSSLAETMDPTELSSFMNKYYESVFEPVGQHGGIVCDVVGDSMLAVWAKTGFDATLKKQACLAALRISRATNQFDVSSGGLQLPTRIGLHSGRMLLGNIGAIHHYEYRAVGDIVNTTTRIEGLNKYLGTQVLVSSDVLYQLDGFLSRELGKFFLPGKSRPIVVHELICRMEESDSEQRRLCSVFSDALNAYRRRSWEEAIEIYHESRRIYGEDGPSLLYLGLCEEYRENPPGETWSEIVSLDMK